MSIGLNSHADGVTGAIQVNGNDVVTVNTSGLYYTFLQNPTLSNPTFTGTVVPFQTASLGVGTTPDGITGDIRATGNIIAYYSSDSRLKENIVPIVGALDKVLNISGNTYDWTDEYIARHGGEDGYFIRKHDVGVIAQEIEAVLPEAVADRQDGFKAVNYEKIVPLLIQAIKELSAKVDSLTPQA